ncbi:MAG: ATP-binding cassette domain-containing protein, partial [Desulfobacterales bacterium]|nr:ATP-binding cassette domain-containing protein [Desulfobacterales bacterium]
MKRLILPYLKRNFAKILAGMIAMIVVDGLQLITPQIIKNAVDALAAGLGDRSVILNQCLIILGLGLAMSLLRYCWRIWLMGSAREVEMGLRDDLFRHALDLDPAFYDTVKTGDVMAHATSDINHVRMAFGFGLIVMVDTLLLGTATLGIMIYTHPKLTLMAMIPMPLLVYFTRKLGQKMHDFHKTAQESFSLLTEMVRESFFGIRVIKVFNFEPFAAQRVSDGSRDYFKKNLKRAVVTALMKPLLGFFFNLSSLIIIFHGGYLAMADQISPGELVAFLQYLNILAWPIIAIGWMTNLFQRGMASLKRISSLLQAQPGIRAPEDGGTPWNDPRGDICFDQVDFGYGAASVLNQVSLTVAPGTRAGISGPPGSGKTSLVQLIPRLYDAGAGRVCLDGKDVKKMDPDHLRSQIAL